MYRIIIKSGERFGRLVVVSDAHFYIKPSGKKERCFNCVCDCGKIKTILMCHLRSGAIRSCGCLSSDTTRDRSFIHGMVKHRIYKSWYQIKQRCSNPKAKDYKHYGARGIGYPKKWETFKGFIEDMGIDYEDGLTIERISNNKSYSRENCRWATRQEQSMNKRNSIIISHNGVRKSLKQWADEIGVCYITLYNRIYTYRWSIQKALNKKS